MFKWVAISFFFLAISGVRLLIYVSVIQAFELFLFDIFGIVIIVELQNLDFFRTK
jgi:hypothetical protein